jgi:head-tail adaptor
MRAGALRHVVYFDEPVATQSDSGDEIVTFTPSFSARASVEPITPQARASMEIDAGSQINALLHTKITVRWSPTIDRITPKWRARLGAVIYNIGVISHLKVEQRTVEIMATSGINVG